MENSELKDRLKNVEESLHDLGLEREKNRALQSLGNEDSDLDTCDQNKLKLENQKLKNSLKEMEVIFWRERCKSLESQIVLRT